MTVQDEPDEYAGEDETDEFAGDAPTSRPSWWPACTARMIRKAIDSALEEPEPELPAQELAAAYEDAEGQRLVLAIHERKAHAADPELTAFTPPAASEETAHPDYTLGQRVAYSTHLKRVYRFIEGSDSRGRKEWTTTPHAGLPPLGGGRGIIVGKRTLSNGENRYNGYDEPITYWPAENFTAYLVAYELRRSPVYVLPEHLTALDEGQQA